MILAVNGAEDRMQVALGRDDRVEAWLDEPCAGRMNEALAPAVARLLDRLGLAPAALAGVACVRGPGSFTGVRLCLAFCHGLCLAAGLPLAGVDYLPLLARGAPAGDADEIHVLTHSRRARVYHQAFRADGPAPLGPPRDVSAALAAADLLERGRKVRVLVLGSGLARNPEDFALLAGVVRIADPAANAPSADSLLAAAAAAPWTGPPVNALYLRGSDAEENLATIAAARGLTPGEAQARLERALR